MKAVDKLSENILDKLSIDFLRSQVLKNAYGNNDTVIAAMGPSRPDRLVPLFWAGPLVRQRPALPAGMFCAGNSHTLR